MIMLNDLENWLEESPFEWEKANDFKKENCKTTGQ